MQANPPSLNVPRFPPLRLSATRSLQKTPNSNYEDIRIWLFRIGAYWGKCVKMNRAEKRRQEKLAKKAASNVKLGKATIRSPGQQTPDIQESLNLAVQHHAAGRLPEAEGIYQRILQADPNQPVALHLLGVVAHQMGKHDIAVDLISKALAFKPEYAEAHNSLGITLKELGRMEDAVANYRKALVIKPDYVEAHYNLGNALKELGKREEAVASYGKVSYSPQIGQ